MTRPRRREGNVLMLHTGRSGSTLLGDLLDQHPGICWDGETIEKFFHFEARRKRQFVRRQYGQYDLDQAIAVLERRQHRLGGPLIFGAEIQPYHLRMLGTDLDSFLDRAISLGFTRFIVLDRRNQLRKIASHVAAYERQTHHVRAGTSVPTPTVRLDPERIFIGYEDRVLTDVLAEWSHFFARLEQRLPCHDCLHLCYEDDLEGNPAIGYGKACDFLGLEPARPVVQYGRTGDFPLSDLISNYDEIAGLLSSTPHAWMAPAVPAAQSSA